MTKERENEIKNILTETERKERDGEIQCFSSEEFREWLIQSRKQRFERYYNAIKTEERCSDTGDNRNITCNVEVDGRMDQDDKI